LVPHNVNLAGQNLDFIDAMIHGPPALNAMPHNIPIDLNAQPHQLNDEDFLELNDLINPAVHHPQEKVVFPLAAPNAHAPEPEDVDMVQPEDIQSDLTVTISPANTLSEELGGSVDGAPQQQQMHIGMALIPEISVDQVAALSSSYGSEKASFFYSREGTISWSSFFKPDGAIVNSVTVLP
jgi:hypothetical protein